MFVDFSGKSVWSVIRGAFNSVINAPTKIGAQIYLRNKGWKYSALFLEHALEKNPKDLKYSNSSQIAKDLKKTSEIKNAVSKFKKSKLSSQKVSVCFSSGDFFGAFHSATITFSKDKKGKITALLYDYYNFALEFNYYNNFITITANNYAWLSQNLGALKNYKIYVTMYF